MGHAYYNEYDAGAAAWLRELIKHGHIAQGEVDERSIVEVHADDLRGFTQCHFFAGIGGWSHALRLAGWPDDRPVWTGSPPCQPFSAAGKRLGKDDERHLAPVWLDLVLQCRPPILFGEQVADAIRVGWLDDLQDRLEAGGYACGSSVLTAASFGAPHIRKRLYFGGVRVGDTDNERLEGQRDGHKAAIGRDGEIRPVASAGEPCGLANAIGKRIGGGDIARPGTRRTEVGEQQDGSSAPNQSGNGREDADWMADATSDGRQRPAVQDWEQVAGIDSESRVVAAGNLQGNRSCQAHGFWGTSDWLGRQDAGGMDDTACKGRCHGQQTRDNGHTESGKPGQDCRTSTSDGFWGSVDLLHCRDGKWRPVEPGTFPLAHGVSGRVGLLRGYGNAIVPQVAQAFIESFQEATN